MTTKDAGRRAAEMWKLEGQRSGSVVQSASDHLKTILAELGQSQVFFSSVRNISFPLIFPAR